MEGKSLRGRTLDPGNHQEASDVSSVTACGVCPWSWGQEYSRVTTSVGKLRKTLTMSPLCCPHGIDTSMNSEDKTPFMIVPHSADIKRWSHPCDSQEIQAGAEGPISGNVSLTNNAHVSEQLRGTAGPQHSSSLQLRCNSLRLFFSSGNRFQCLQMCCGKCYLKLS